MILCSNDAKSYYDRIIHSISSLALQRLSMLLEPIKYIFSAIQKMDHYIRTAYEISDSSLYGSDESIPNQGILQGNGSSPVTWVAISTLLINCIKVEGYKLKVVMAISKEKSSLIGYMLVDDTDLIRERLFESTNDIDDTMQKMQKAIHTWEDLLKTTGDVIRPDKSFVYPISFKFDNKGRYKFKTTSKLELSFSVKDENN